MNGKHTSRQFSIWLGIATAWAEIKALMMQVEYRLFIGFVDDFVSHIQTEGKMLGNG